MKITLTTRTPVHIGTGLTYHPNEYVLTRTPDGIQFFSRINQSALLKGLTNDQRDALSEDLQDEYFSLGDFFKTHALKYGNFRRYRAENHTRKKDPTEIRECIKNAHKPYIPGSSLKGAVRTALLWWHAKMTPGTVMR
jgi:CRISPR-associated protein Csm5